MTNKTLYELHCYLGKHQFRELTKFKEGEFTLIICECGLVGFLSGREDAPWKLIPGWSTIEMLDDATEDFEYVSRKIKASYDLEGRPNDY